MGERMVVDVRGIVQGVGFRPYVHALATSLALRGFVQNRGSHVVIDVEGAPDALEAFVAALRSSAPPLASIDRIEWHYAAAVQYTGFEIAPSHDAGERDVRIAADVATCRDCLSELFDAADRRFRYPFINCTACGPRYTIVTGVPYDRPRTTMHRFAMCAACRREYEDPRNRRFHAQPIACPLCGPVLAAFESGSSVTQADPLGAASRALASGWIVAVKGLGGYHLACDGTNAGGVAALRRRKRRDAKPFALMLPESAIAGIDNPAARAAVTSRERPIVLLDRAECPEIAALVAPNVAPGSPAVGVMLPYTPLHHLLLRDTGRPLVMTSGNRTDEPIAYADEDACERLQGIADLFLTHDRPIHARCDDTVVRIAAGAATPVRRARGYAPAPIVLAEPASVPVLAVGGHLKNTFCMLRDRDAYMSPHIGDLETTAAYAGLQDGVASYMRLLEFEPAVVAHDLHPDYLSTRFAEQLPVPARVAVQHHHAHVLSCAAEHGVTEPVLGVAFDGAGLGTDGAIWGGEFLLVADCECRRVAHLAYVPQPGGDAAAREPWRMALAHLMAAYGPDLAGAPAAAVDRIAERGAATLRQMIARDVAAPRTSSMGRMFDAVASLAGLRRRAEFEGQAAMELESIAAGRASGAYRFELQTSVDPWRLDPAPVIRSIAADVAAGRAAAGIASGFHDAAAAAIVDVVHRLAAAEGLRHVALTGGVFQNRVLADAAAERLARAGLNVLIHRRVPCNDGGLSLGQAVFASRAVRFGALDREQSVCV